MKNILLLLSLFFVSAASAQTTGFVVTSDAASSTVADRLYRVNLENGESTSLGVLGGVFEDVEGIAQDKDGNLFGLDDATKTLVSINTLTGRATALGNGNGNTRISLGESNAQDPSLSFSCSNELFAVTKNTRSLYKGNVTTGVLDLIGTAGTVSGGITDIAFRGEELFGLGEQALYQIDVKTGVSTLVGAYGNNIGFADGGGLSVDATGQLWAIAETRRADATLENSVIYKIDAKTGAASRVSSTVVGVESLSIGSTPCAVEGTVPLVTQLPALNPFALILLSISVLLSAFYFAPRR